MVEENERLSRYKGGRQMTIETIIALICGACVVINLGLLLTCMITLWLVNKQYTEILKNSAITSRMK